MKKVMAMLVLFCVLAGKAMAQRRIDRTEMNYLIGVKPNNIIYRDTLYTGSKQFMQLFYRTRNAELIDLYEKHQSNKVAGNVMSYAGTIATIIGISMVSSGNNKGTGWAVLGGGFATTLTGGYLIFKGQQNLMNAIIIFNNQYNRTSLGIGVGDRSGGLVLNF